MPRRRGPRRVPERPTAREREVRLLFEELKGTGRSLPEFCRERGLKLGTMSWWRYQLRLRDAKRGKAAWGVRREAKGTGGNGVDMPSPAASSSRPKGAPPLFVELVPRPSGRAERRAAGAGPSSGVEVVVDGRRRVDVQCGFDPATLAEVVRVLEVL